MTKYVCIAGRNISTERNICPSFYHYFLFRHFLVIQLLKYPIKAHIIDLMRDSMGNIGLKVIRGRGCQHED